MATERYMAKRPFGYGRFAMLDRGQIFELANLPNDEKLIRLGYVSEVPDDFEGHECGECGAEFVGMAERAAHARERHIERDLTPEEEDRRADRQERMLEQVAPLNLDKTIVSAGRVVARKIVTPQPAEPATIGAPEPTESQ